MRWWGGLEPIRACFKPALPQFDRLCAATLTDGGFDHRFDMLPCVASSSRSRNGRRSGTVQSG
jgi:hypothetical protein